MLFIEADEDRPLTLRDGIVCGFRSIEHLRAYLATVTDPAFKGARPPTADDHFPFEPWDCLNRLQAEDFDHPDAHDVLFWTATFGLIALRYLGIDFPPKYREALAVCADVLTFEANVHVWLRENAADIELVSKAFGLVGGLVYPRIELVADSSA